MVKFSLQKTKRSEKKKIGSLLKISFLLLCGVFEVFLKRQQDLVSMTLYRHWLKLTHPQFHPIFCAWCFLLAGHHLWPRASQQEILGRSTWKDLICRNLLLKFLALITCFSVSGLNQNTMKFCCFHFCSLSLLSLYQMISLLQWKGIKLEGSG